MPIPVSSVVLFTEPMTPGDLLRIVRPDIDRRAPRPYVYWHPVPTPLQAGYTLTKPRVPYTGKTVSVSILDR